MSLAIVIPYFKHTFFEDTLQSLASQTNKNFKVYIGDDASQQSPNELLEKYKNKFHFIYHRFDDNLGGTSLTKQWDRCIDLSNNEEWIMILGDDDVLDQNVVEALYNSLNEISEKKISVVRFATRIKTENSTLKTPDFTHPKIETIFDFHERKFNGKTRSSLSEYIFKSTMYRQHGFKDYPLAWHSDDMAWMVFSENGFVYSISEAKITIRVSEHSISGRTIDLHQKDLSQILFYTDLINKFLHRFSKNAQLMLLLRYEIMLKAHNKMTFQKWFVIFKKYCQIGSLLKIIKLIRRIFIHLRSK